MKIGILGGSFDPPHLGHIFIATQVKELLGLDQVWLMPLFEKSQQDEVFHKQMSSVSHREAMTRLLESEFIRVSDFEIKRNKSSFTIDTLSTLQSENPNDTFYWITGSDQLPHFQKYKDWQELVSNHNFVFFPREWILPEFEERVKEALDLKTIPTNVIVLHDKNLVLTNISSTRIRERVKAGLSIELFVPEQIDAYIKTHTLYGH